MLSGFTNFVKNALMAKTEILTYSAARAKAQQYCAFQERSQQEVRDKLYAWGMTTEEVENLIVDLIQENYLNEERFALAYAGGKNRIKKWGKYKIQQGLKAKGVSAPLIKMALESLDEIEYRANLEQLLAKKRAQVKDVDTYKGKMSLINYALSKGYEQSLIFDILNDNEL